MGKKAVIFDLDGTIYYGDTIIDGVYDVLDTLESKNFEIIFFTNNSSRNRKEIYKKLIDLDVKTSINSVYNSSYATSQYLIEKNIKNIYLIGTSSFKDELENLSINVLEPKQAEAVVVGLNTQFCYEDIAQGLEALNNGALLIASNVDRNFPITKNDIKPACNAIVSSLIGCLDTNIKPIIIGKPNTYLLEIISKEKGLSKKDMWVVGDKEESDIEMANRFGCNSILVGNNGINIKNIIERIVK